ncbi:MAG TPA: alpha/beta hydrolase [Burkholderiaceae bacterium]|jgi:pimeloyl-ACP methyl ester carboxylesterase
MLIESPRSHAATVHAPGCIRVADGANGVDLFYRDWGAGKPLLFMSGWTLNSSMWGYQMEPLAKAGFRCVAYDRRAHGRSSDPGRGYDFDTLADDLAAVIEALDLSDVVLVAHSFASGEVVRYLSRHGSRRIAGVVFIAPAAIPFLLKTADNPGGIDSAVIEQIQTEQREDFPAWAQAGADAYFAGAGSTGIVNATLGMMNQTSHQAMLALARLGVTTDFRSELGRIDIPTLLIHGDRDASAPLELTSQPAHQLIPGSQLTVYSGGPHGLYFTHKANLNEDIARFAQASGSSKWTRKSLSRQADTCAPGASVDA